MSKISISLVTWNGEKYIKHCINSILQQTFKDYEVNIFDNNSNDTTIEIIEKNFPCFKIFKNKKNIGFAAAHNKLFAWAKSDYILCLNQDIIMEPNFLENAFDFLHNAKNLDKIAAIEPKLLHWEFNNEDPYNADKHGKTNIIDTCGFEVFRNHKVIDVGQLEEDGQKFNEKKEIFGTSAACPIYSKKVLESIKINNEYFDEDFFNYKEDVDLAFRIRLAGYKCYFLANVIAYHDRSIKKGLNAIQNRKNRSSWVNEYSYRNHIYLLIKNEFFANFIKCFFSLFIYEFKKFIYILFFEHETLKFFFKNFKLISKMFKKRKYIFKNIVRIKSRELYNWYK
ncbi:MAG: glycosyltransferase family 2 protein [Patescibacteria group bacterium]|nr:glycosyltransferase family 2 protein [Patescibacteria group bacterium]